MTESTGSFQHRIKKIIIGMMLVLNIVPYYNSETSSLKFPGVAMAQGYGAKGRTGKICECGGVFYTVPCEPGTTCECPECFIGDSVTTDLCPFCGHYPCTCGLVIDPCDTGSEYYDLCLCHGINCFPGACNPASPRYDECECLGINCIADGDDEYNCPCIINLTSLPEGGILRNKAGSLLFAPGNPEYGRLGYPQSYYFKYTDAVMWLSDGKPISLTHIEGLTIDGEETVFQNYSYNCLGWVLADAKFVFYTNQTKDVNGALGITGVNEAISSGIIKMSETCEGIQHGQILLLFDETNHYIHAAVYEGDGLYSTKNGLGLGESVQYWTLQQIQAYYYTYDSGAVKSGYINAPPGLINESSLGIDTDGLITAAEYSAATTNCTCSLP